MTTKTATTASTASTTTTTKQANKHRHKRPRRKSSFFLTTRWVSPLLMVIGSISFLGLCQRSTTSDRNRESNALQSLHTTLLPTRDSDTAAAPTMIIKRMETQQSLLSLSSSYDKRSKNPSTPDDNQQSSFCTYWDVNVDEWWTHHPTWEIALQNQTHQCFQSISNPKRAALLQDLYQIQWPAQETFDCDASADDEQVFYKVLSNSGWGADVSHVVDGLSYALQHRVPVYPVFPVPWQYATGRSHRQDPVCPQADLSCYFLPLNRCMASAAATTQAGRTFAQNRPRWNQGPLTAASQARYLVPPWKSFYHDESTLWLLEYATRAQTWLRHKAVDLAATVPLPTSCSVLHVRRADVVLHGRFSRAYHKLGEYIKAAGPQLSRHILLLTDDANAISEALAYNARRRQKQQQSRQLPQGVDTSVRSSSSLTWQQQQEQEIEWFYLDRPRHKGPEGGFENQIPSEDPEFEVVALLAEFLLVQRCNLLVHSKSNLADYFYAIMLTSARHNGNGKMLQKIDIDQYKDHARIHNANNAETVRFSKEFVN